MKTARIYFGSTMSAMLVLGVLVALCGEPAVYASDYPNKSIVFVVGSSPGGGFDLQGRLFSKYWPKYLPNNVSMIVKNIDGGGGLRSANQVWIAPPDGYTVIQLKPGPYILDEIIQPKQIKFKMKEWEYIGQYTYNVSVLIARTAVAEKIKKYQDLVNLARQKPLKYATGGAGGSIHTKEIIFSEAAELPAQYVHFPGVAEGIASMMRGEVDFTIMSVVTALKVDPKEIRIVFLMNDEKGLFASAAPTAHDFGIPRDVVQKVSLNPVFVAPRVLAVPPKTPPNVVQILRDSFWKLVTSKEFNDAFAKVDDFIEPMKGEDFAKVVPDMFKTVEKFAPSVKDLLVK